METGGRRFSTARRVRPGLSMLDSPGMAGSKRVLGLQRAFAPGAMACVVLGASACFGGGPDVAPYVQSGTGGGLNLVGGAGFEATSTGGALIFAAGAGCVLPPAENPVFKAQAVDRSSPARRELYSWTTDEQAAALRSDQVLFTRVEQEGLGPGYAFTYLNQFAAPGPNQTPEQQQLAAVLCGDLFAKKRYAWSEPWATRMGWPGEDYGGNLLRIVLKPEAWLVVVSGGALSVSDLENQPVALSAALLHPERIAAILYVKDEASGGPTCNSSFVGGINGYREFILGNLAMVEEWSLGTQLIRDRLAANIADLTRFLGQMRACPSSEGAQQWNLRVVCNWSADLGAANDEVLLYEQALAIPSSNYLPVPQQIAAIIETLQGDLFEPNPLVVKPGSP
jgi:hypothetical protein